MRTRDLVYYSSIRALLKREGLPVGVWKYAEEGLIYTGRLTVQQEDNGVIVTDLEYGKKEDILSLVVMALNSLPFPTDIKFENNKLFIKKVLL